MTTLTESAVIPLYCSHANSQTNALLGVAWIAWQYPDSQDITARLVRSLAPVADPDLIAEFASSAHTLLATASKTERGLTDAQMDDQQCEAFVSGLRKRVRAMAAELTKQDESRTLRSTRLEHIEVPA